MEGASGIGSVSQLGNSPTITHGATELGVILGTAAYMAPEQAKGRPADKRADIWAFGVIVYEILTGQRLFAGETVSETLAEVLKTQIDWTALSVETPPAIRQLLRRLLERDPKNRLHDIADARIVLDEVIAGRSDEAGAGVGTPFPARARFGVLQAAALTAALLAAALLGWALRRPAATPAAVQRWALAIPEGLEFSTAEAVELALSADGRQQVAAVEDASGTTRLLLRRDDELEPRLLPDTERAGAPFFSPDGAWIGFFRDGELAKIPVAGGPPIRIAAVSGQPRGATWSRDGFIYFSPDTVVPLSRVSEHGGGVEAVTKLLDERLERSHRWPDALPDGSAVIFTSDTQMSSEYYDDARIEAVRPDTGERKVLIEGSSQARFLEHGANDYLVFARGGSLFAVPFEAKSLTVRGSPVQVAQGVFTTVGTGAVQFAFATTGAALWAPGVAVGLRRIPVWFDLDGTETPLSIAPGFYNELALAADGKRAALVSGEGGVADLWVADLERGALTRLTFGEFVTMPTWTPDGSRIAYGTRLQKPGGATWQIAWEPADGSGEPEVLVGDERSIYPGCFTPDGRFLLFDRLNPKATQRDILLLPLEGARQPQPLVEGPFMKSMAALSPDGRFMAYVSNESGRPGVYVRPFPQGEGQWQVSTTSGTEPRWSPDGRAIFYRDAGMLFRVPVDTARGFTAGRPERLFERVSRGQNPRTYSPAPDGRRFLIRPRDPTPPGHQLNLDLGFAAGIDRLTSRPGA